MAVASVGGASVVSGAAAAEAKFPPGQSPEEIHAAILALKAQLLFSTEADLQRGLAVLLAAAGVDAEREFGLDALSRVDFMTQAGVAIEAKVKGGPAAVIRQLTRYARHPGVKAIVLVTTKVAHYRAVPKLIEGKPVLVAWIAGVTH